MSLFNFVSFKYALFMAICQTFVGFPHFSLLLQVSEIVNIMPKKSRKELIESDDDIPDIAKGFLKKLFAMSTEEVIKCVLIQVFCAIITIQIFVSEPTAVDWLEKCREVCIGYVN